MTTFHSLRLIIASATKFVFTYQIDNIIVNNKKSSVNNAYDPTYSIQKFWYLHWKVS